MNKELAFVMWIKHKEVFLIQYYILSPYPDMFALDMIAMFEEERNELCIYLGESQSIM